MALEYFPLIGIDASRNEHSFEWPGKNWDEAARSGAMRYSYLKVLSNYAGQKRGGNGSGMYNRKVLYEAPQHEGLNGSAEMLPDIPLLPGIGGQRADILALRLIKQPSELIQKLRGYGFVLYLKDVEGKTKLFNDRRVTCAMTKPEIGQVNDLVRERRREIIAAIEAEEHAPNPPDETEENDDPLKGRKIQDIMLSMLPQMPTPFTTDDLVSRLKAAGFTEFAADRTRVNGNIQYAITKKQIESAGRGKYRVVEAFRHRRSDHPLREAYDSAMGEAAEKQPEPIIATPEPQPELPLESLQPPREVIEVGPPPPDPQPKFNLQTALRVIEAPPEPPLQTQRTPQPIVNPQAALIATVLDLASQAAAGGGDTASLAAQANTALEQLQSDVLNAIDAFTCAFQPLIEQWNKQAATRQALVNSLTCPAEVKT